MGDINQLYFTEKFVKKLKGPVLEIGSKNYGNTQNLRPLFSGKKYIGLDLEEGDGVDLVVDLSKSFNIVDKKLNHKLFKTIICYSVLEHCINPLKMAENIYKLLDKGGFVLISVPFVWRVHGYPSDYWRFTAEGIKALFPKINFDLSNCFISTCNPGELKRFDEDMFRSELTIKKGLQRRKFGIISALFIYLFRKIKIFPFIFKYPHLFPPTMINMIGVK